MSVKDEQAADQAFAAYMAKKEGGTVERLLAWYQGEWELSAALQQFSKTADLDGDGHTRFIENLARGARKLRTGLEYYEPPPRLRVAA